MASPASRKCSRCEVVKPLQSFPKRSWSQDGRGLTCHRCKSGLPPADAVGPQFKRQLAVKKYYIITAAQNSTKIHADFLETLQVAAKHLDAELIVVPLRYRNPTSIWTDKQNREEKWAPELLPYLYDSRKKLGPNLVLAADIKVQPTSSNPLGGFEGLTGAESCIIGHPKMQFRTIAVSSGRFPKILSTTGVCTRKNYTDSKSGAIGAFHHYLGAVIVEMDGQKFHLRQINADRTTGSFIDKDSLYTANGVQKAPPAQALILGDVHVRVMDPKVDAATFGPGGIVETLDPKELIFHDVKDGSATNPHELGNPFITAAKIKARGLNVREELLEVVRYLSKRVKGRKAVVIDSNHSDFLSRWMLRTDWRLDVNNADFYLETAQAMLASAKMTGSGPEYIDPFRFWMSKLCPEVVCLGPNDSYRISDIECGLHGHRGPNGARGSLKNLSRLGSRVISGHSHSPGIEGGHYQVGTSTPRRLNYNLGPGSWLNTHCVIYANGKRSLITVIDGAWRR